MNFLQTILILAAAFLAVFGEAAFPLLRHWLGAQVDLLPALMVYAALNADIVTVSLLAVLGGLWFDALSANPLGRQHPAAVCRRICDLSAARPDFARAAVRAIRPRRGRQRRRCRRCRVLLLLTGGQQPLLGWGSLWQWLVMTAGGAVATPIIFALFDWCQHALGYQPRTETSFRPDREIRRGRIMK